MKLSVEASQPYHSDVIQVSDLSQTYNTFSKSLQEKKEYACKCELYRLECEQKVAGIKKWYEEKCQKIEAKMRKKQDGLIDAVSALSEKNQYQEDEMCKKEFELQQLRTNLITKTHDVEQLRRDLAEHETELDKMKQVVERRSQELEQLKHRQRPPSPIPLKASLTLYQSQITLCEEARAILENFRVCSEDSISKMEHELKKKIDQITTLKRRRWTTL